MASASLIEANPLNWNRIPFLLPHPISNPTFKSRLLFVRNTKTSRPSLTLKCVLSKLPNNTASINELQPAVLRNRILDAFLNAIEALRQPAVVAALLMYDPHSALAASGGRMGGSSFSSQSSSSSGSYSSRSSAPSFSYSALSSSSSRSYSSRSTGPSFSYSAPYNAPSVGFGVGLAEGFLFMGFAVGLGVAAWWGLEGCMVMFIFMLTWFFACVVYLDWNKESVLTAVDKTSVMKLQVGLLGMGRSLQKDLNRIAEVADTSTPEGLSYVLTETALALLRHPDYCISGYSFVDVKSSMDEGEKRFNQLSIEEQGKFDKETLVNVNNIRRQSSTGQRSGGFSNEYMVVTILVAAEGVHKLPSINGSKDLMEALQKVASIPASKASKTLAVEVLWTPQNENDILSERELLEDYPLLRPL
ncbi:unnamed protein product [Rhodiola kirilowii]